MTLDPQRPRDPNPILEQMFTMLLAKVGKLGPGQAICYDLSPREVMEFERKGASQFAVDILLFAAAVHRAPPPDEPKNAAERIAKFAADFGFKFEELRESGNIRLWHHVPVRRHSAS